MVSEKGQGNLLSLMPFGSFFFFFCLCMCVCVVVVGGGGGGGVGGIF